jgi:hypothetical protein
MRFSPLLRGHMTPRIRADRPAPACRETLADCLADPTVPEFAA